MGPHPFHDHGRHGDARACARSVAALLVAIGLLIPVFAAAQPWTADGPEVIRDGQVEGQQLPVPPNPVVGGIKAVVPVPGNADQVILGTVNGGIWRTTNFSNASPTWAWVTPNATFPATNPVTPTGIGALSFTRNDASQAYAGLGLFSAYLQWGTSLAGPLGLGGTTSSVTLLRTKDAGATWSPVTFTVGSDLDGVNITGVQSRGDNVVVVTGRRDTYYGAQLTPRRGFWRSDDADRSNTQCLGAGAPYVCCTGAGTGACAPTAVNLATGIGNAAGLPVGDYTDVVNGPGNLSLMYTAVVNTVVGNESGV
jgi:hypothetical protein